MKEETEGDMSSYPLHLDPFRGYQMEASNHKRRSDPIIDPLLPELKHDQQKVTLFVPPHPL